MTERGGLFRGLLSGSADGVDRLFHGLRHGFLHCLGSLVNRRFVLELGAADVAVYGISGQLRVAVRTLLLILHGVDMSVDNVKVFLELLDFGDYLRDLRGGVNAEYLLLVGKLSEVSELLVDLAPDLGGGNLVL